MSTIRRQPQTETQFKNVSKLIKSMGEQEFYDCFRLIQIDINFSIFHSQFSFRAEDYWCIKFRRKPFRKIKKATAQTKRLNHKTFRFSQLCSDSSQFVLNGSKFAMRSLFLFTGGGFCQHDNWFPNLNVSTVKLNLCM